MIDALNLWNGWRLPYLHNHVHTWRKTTNTKLSPHYAFKQYHFSFRQKTLFLFIYNCITVYAWLSFRVLYSTMFIPVQVLSMGNQLKQFYEMCPWQTVLMWRIDMKNDDNKLSSIPKFHIAEKEFQSWATRTPRKIQVGLDAAEE